MSPPEELPVGPTWPASILLGWRTLRVLDDGFVLRDRTGETTYRDSDVREIGVRVDRDYSSGSLESISWRVGLRIAGPDGDRTLVLHHHASPEPPIPFSGWLDRSLEALVERARAELAAGRSIQSDGWTLRPDRLELADRVATYSEFGAIARFAGYLSVWRRGEDVPFARFPEDGPNVLVLQRLLQDRIRIDGRPLPHDDLGRVLFESRPRYESWVCALAAIAAVLVGLVLTGPSLVAAYAAAGVLAIASAWLAGVAFRCHERGVARTTLLGERRLRYDEVWAFQFQAVRHFRHFINASYDGTSLELRFIPAPGTGASAFSYRATVHGTDDDLVRLRDHVAGIVADRLESELRRRGTVAWSRDFHLTEKGLETPAGLVPFADLGEADGHDGEFRLRVRGETEPSIRLPADEVNFFPGLALLRRLVGTTSEGAPQDR